MESSSALGFVESVLAASCRKEQAQSAIKNKVRGKRLLLEHGAHTVAPGETLRRMKKRCQNMTPGTTPRPNRARRRELLLDAVAKVTHDQLLTQHRAWLDYAQSALHNTAAEDRTAVVARLDWHGARVRVARSKSTAYAKLQGLVLTETRRMLLLLSETRRTWIPKVGTAVEVTLPNGSWSDMCETTERMHAPPPQ